MILLNFNLKNEYNICCRKYANISVIFISEPNIFHNSYFNFYTKYLFFHIDNLDHNVTKCKLFFVHRVFTCIFSILSNKAIHT
jgi:hypothetical protein